MKRRKIFRFSIPFALAVIIAAATFALFGGSDVTQQTPAAVDETFSVGTSAMRAYLDPETGQLEMRRAVASEFELDAETREALRRDTEGLVPQYHPDGSVSVNLQGRFQNATLVHIDENGVKTICTDHANCAQRVLDPETASDKTPEVK